jgi:hypothetical protein
VNQPCGKNRSITVSPIPTAANGNPRPVPGEEVHTERSGSQAAIDPLQLAPAMESETHVGSNVKNPFPSDTSACSGFNRNGLVSELGSATRVASPAGQTCRLLSPIAQKITRVAAREGDQQESTLVLGRDRFDPTGTGLVIGHRRMTVRLMLRLGGHGAAMAPLISR